VSSVQYYLIDVSASTRLIYIDQAKDIPAKIYNKTAVSNYRQFGYNTVLLLSITQPP